MGLRLEGEFPDLAGKVERAALATMLEVAEDQQTHARQIIRQEKRYDRRMLVNAIKSSRPERTAKGYRVVTSIQPPADDYGTVQDLGRRKGKRPPPTRPIEAWIKRRWPNPYAGMQVGHVGVQQRFSAQAKARYVKSLAYLVARKIGREGIEGIHFIRRTRKWMQGRIRKIWKRNWARERAGPGR